MHDAGKQQVVVLGLLATVSTACLGLYIMVIRQKKHLVALEDKLRRQEVLKSAEHSGRINAEKELRSFMSSRMELDGGLFFAPIGTVHSCFKECVDNCSIVFDRSSVSPVSLEGLEGFSHLWVFWAFHLNTNVKDVRAHSGVRPDSRGHTFPAKVSPPFLKKRVGVFCTRTPHRPNPIGVSLCKVEEVDTAERSVGLSGVDLVDGTPVLDIKPYVPDYDCPRAADSGFPDDRGDRGYVRVADWVGESVKHRRKVEWTPEAELQLEEACSGGRRRRGTQGPLKFFRGDHEGARRAITESLAVDVRSLRKTREAAASPSCHLLFDGLRVEFTGTVSAGGAGSAEDVVPQTLPSAADAPGAGGSAASGSAGTGAEPGSAETSDSAVSGRDGSERVCVLSVAIASEAGHAKVRQLGEESTTEQPTEAEPVSL